MLPYVSKTPEEHHDEDEFIVGAKQRSSRDLTLVREMKVDSEDVTERLREEVGRNHWAETVRQALRGAEDD